jgi:hypothetical protein
MSLFWGFSRAAWNKHETYNKRHFMKSGFKDRTAIHNEKPMKSPWDFTCPDYDQRSSCFVNAGSHYGVGHRQPVGTKKHSGKNAVPTGKTMGMTVDEVPIKNLIIDFES